MALRTDKRFWFGITLTLAAAGFYLYGPSSGFRVGWEIPCLFGLSLLAQAIALAEGRGVDAAPPPSPATLRRNDLSSALAASVAVVVLVAITLTPGRSDWESAWSWYFLWAMLSGGIAISIYCVIRLVKLPAEEPNRAPPFIPLPKAAQWLFYLVLAITLGAMVRNQYHRSRIRGLGYAAERADAAAIAELNELCGRGKGRACYELGFLYDLGNSRIPEDFPTAEALYEKGCVAGSGRSCQFLAGRYRDGRKTARNYQRAYELLEQCHRNGDSGDCLARPERYLADECGEHDPDECLMLAWIYRTGRGVEVDLGKSAAAAKPTLDRYESECRKGEAWACGALAEEYRFDGALAPDPVKETEYRGLACAAGVTDYCPPPPPHSSPSPSPRP